MVGEVAFWLYSLFFHDHIWLCQFVDCHEGTVFILLLVFWRVTVLLRDSSRSIVSKHVMIVLLLLYRHVYEMTVVLIDTHFRYFRIR